MQSCYECPQFYACLQAACTPEASPERPDDLLVINKEEEEEDTLPIEIKEEEEEEILVLIAEDITCRNTLPIEINTHRERRL